MRTRELSTAVMLLYICFAGASDREEKQTEDTTDLKVFRGKFDGECTGDGLYYMDEHSFIMCNSKNFYIQPCPPGTMNRPYDGFLSGSEYDFENFCDINLVNFGYTEQKLGYGVDSENESGIGYEEDKNNLGPYMEDSKGERRSKHHKQDRSYYNNHPENEYHRNSENRVDYNGPGKSHQYRLPEDAKPRRGPKREEPPRTFYDSNGFPFRATDPPPAPDRGRFHNRNDRFYQETKPAGVRYDETAPRYFGPHKDGPERRGIRRKERRRKPLDGDRSKNYEIDTIYRPGSPESEENISKNRDIRRENGIVERHGHEPNMNFAPEPYRRLPDRMSPGPKPGPIRAFPQPPHYRPPHRPMQYKMTPEPFAHQNIHPKHFENLPEHQRSTDDGYIYMVISMPKSMVTDKGVHYRAGEMEKGVKIIGYHNKDGKYTPFEESM